MKLSIIPNLSQNNSLRQDFVIRIIALTLLLSFILVAGLLFIYQYSKHLENKSRREAIQKIISQNMSASAKFGDIIYARAESIQLGKELGLLDLGICTGQRDVFERIDDTRCKESKLATVEKTKSQLTLDSVQYEIEFSWQKEELSFFKGFLVSFFASLFISIFIVFPVLFYLLKNFLSKLQNVIVMLLDRHSEEAISKSSIQSNEIPEEFINLDKIIERKNDELRKATSQRVFYELSKKVSHDIRSPLNVINELSKKISYQLKEEEIVFKHAISRINSISEDILGVEKINRFKQESCTVDSIYNTLVKVVSEKKIEFINKGLSININLDSFDKLQKVSIDLGTLERIISNLINNSQESLASKNISSKAIDVKIKSFSDYLLIQIRDNGVGLSYDLISKIKNKEKNVSSNGGNGIGLSSAVEYLNYQGGYLDINSIEGEGCQIDLYLIASSAATLHTDIDFAFIDDEQINHISWKNKAQKNKLNGIYFKNIEDFLFQNLSNKKIPIFLDYFLGDKNGIEEASKLYSQGFEEIYLCTNYNLDDVVLPTYIKKVVSKDISLSNLHI